MSDDIQVGDIVRAELHDGEILIGKFINVRPPWHPYRGEQIIELQNRTTRIVGINRTTRASVSEAALYFLEKV